MYSMIENALKDWSEANNERSKLQHTYIVAAVALIVIAGLIGLIDYELGQQLTTIALISLGVFFINLVVWTLLQGIVLTPLSAKAERTKQKTIKKKSVKKSKKATKK